MAAWLATAANERSLQFEFRQRDSWRKEKSERGRGETDQRASERRSHFYRSPLSSLRLWEYPMKARNFATVRQTAKPNVF